MVFSCFPILLLQHVAKRGCQFVLMQLINLLDPREESLSSVSAKLGASPQALPSMGVGGRRDMSVGGPRVSDSVVSGNNNMFFLLLTILVGALVSGPALAACALSLGFKPQA